MAITAALVKELRERTGAGMMECKKALTETGGDIEAAIELMRKSGKAKAVKKAGRVAAEGMIVIKLADDNKRAIMIEVNSETDFVSRDENFKNFANTLAERALEENISDIDALMAVPYAKGGSQSIEDARHDVISKLGENINVRRIALVESTGIIGSYCHGQRIGVLVELSTDNLELSKDIAMHIAASRPQAIAPEDVSNELIEKEKEIFSAQAESSGKPADIVEKMVIGRINKFLAEVSLLGQAFVKDPSETVSALLKKADNAKVLAFQRFEVGEGVEKKEEDFAEEVMAQIKGGE